MRFKKRLLCSIGLALAPAVSLAEGQPAVFQWAAATLTRAGGDGCPSPATFSVWKDGSFRATFCAVGADHKTSLQSKRGTLLAKDRPLLDGAAQAVASSGIANLSACVELQTPPLPEDVAMTTADGQLFEVYDRAARQECWLGDIDQTKTFHDELVTLARAYSVQ